MPLEELLALYGYNTRDKESSSESEEDEEHMQNEQEQICELIVEKERSPTPPRQSKLSLLYEPIVEDVDDCKNLTSIGNFIDSKLFIAKFNFQRFLKLARTKRKKWNPIQKKMTIRNLAGAYT